jgi:hypothetical protein
LSWTRTWPRGANPPRPALADLPSIAIAIPRGAAPSSPLASRPPMASTPRHSGPGVVGRLSFNPHANN